MIIKRLILLLTVWWKSLHCVILRPKAEESPTGRRSFASLRMTKIGFFSRLLILLSIAVTTSVLAEEIKLTTIIPDQTILRAKKAAIGDTYSNPGTVSDGSIPTDALLVEGNVGIGTSNPATKLEVNGIMRLAPTAKPAPGTEIPGMIYYDSSATPGIMYYYNGSAWVPMGGGSGSAFGIWNSSGNSWWGVGSSEGAGMDFSTDIIAVAYAENCNNLAVHINNTLIARSRSIAGVFATRCITFPVRKNDDFQVSASGGSANKKLLALPIQ